MCGSKDSEPTSSFISYKVYFKESNCSLAAMNHTPCGTTQVQRAVHWWWFYYVVLIELFGRQPSFPTLTSKYKHEGYTHKVCLNKNIERQHIKGQVIRTVLTHRRLNQLWILLTKTPLMGMSSLPSGELIYTRLKTDCAKIADCCSAPITRKRRAA